MGENGIMRVGIIGAGWIATKAAITLNGLKDCECYAIASRPQETPENPYLQGLFVSAVKVKAIF
jgi:predicted dehydrogenase